MDKFKRPIILTCVSVLFAAIVSSGIFLSRASDPSRSKGKAAASKEVSQSAISSPAAAFTAGNLVIYRVGTGSAALSNAATAVFLDEYTPTGTLVQSIAMPVAAQGSNNILTASGTATSEGFISRSADGSRLVFAGYNKAPGGSNPSADAPATTARVLGLIDSSADFDTRTALNDPTGNIRGAASDNGSNVWFTTSSNGIRHAIAGTSGSSTQISTDLTNLRVPVVADGRLFVSTSSGSTVRIGSVGTGLPVSTGQSITNLPGFPATTIAPYAFFFADLSGAVSGIDTMYYADDTAGTVSKYSLVAGTWTTNGSVAAATARGLAGSVSGSSVSLFITNGTGLSTVTDSSGYNAAMAGSVTSLATAPTNTAFRGVAFAPSSQSSALADLNGDGRTDYLIVRAPGGIPAASFAGDGTKAGSRLSTRERLRNRAASRTSLQGGSAPIAWYGLTSGENSFFAAEWGDANTDDPLTADYDGDGKADIAVWRPVPEGAYFFSLNSSDFTLRQTGFGQELDIPYVVGDYDGDGKDDPAVYRCPENAPGTCYFFWRPSSIPNPGDYAYAWGTGQYLDYLPLTGDFNGDGRADFAIQGAAPSNPQYGVFYVSINGVYDFQAFEWGLFTDRLVPGDFDGDGRSDITVTRVIDGVLWWFVLERDGETQFVPWGIDFDFEAPGDYDGDGRDDFAIYRWNTTDAAFWVKPANGGAHFGGAWGQPGDYPATYFIVQ